MATESEDFKNAGTEPRVMIGSHRAGSQRYVARKRQYASGGVHLERWSDRAWTRPRSSLTWCGSIPEFLTLSCKICLSLVDHIAAPRHVSAWNDLTAAEQFGLLARLSEALAAGAKGFAASEEHGHFHLRLTTAAVQRLTTGGADPLLPLITHDIDKAEQVDLAVAFAMTSGVALIEPWLRDLLGRGGRLRVVVGDYVDVTEPAALRRLSDLEGADLYVHQTGRGSFNPKA